MRPAIRIITWYVLLAIPMIAVLYADGFFFSADVAVVALIAISVVAFRRISWLYDQNRQLGDRATDAVQMKKDFVSHVSHELKAPLASMQETTHLMLERIPGPLTEKQQRLLDLTLQSGKRLAGMIGNLLDLSRLEGGVVDYEMQVQDVGEIAENVVVEFSSQAFAKSIRILTDIPREPLPVICDANRMVQILTNLMDNALRFSSKGGIVSVHVRSVRTVPARAPRPITAECGYILIAIGDSGPGIEDEHKQAIFNIFHQVRRGRKTPGQSLGLGLPIARALVEAHHGRIWVEDNPGGGSVFFVLLPRATQEPSALPRAS